MKRTHKKVLGFLGLLVVTAITAFAILLPSPTTRAITSVTDTIQVRVVGSHPDVYINNIINNEITVIPEQTFTVGFADVDEVNVTMDHTDMYGVVTPNIPVDHFLADYGAGERNYVVHFINNS